MSNDDGVTQPSLSAFSNELRDLVSDPDKIYKPCLTLSKKNSALCMLKFVHLFNNSPFLSSFMSYQGFCSQFLSLIQFTFNRTCLFVSVTKYNPVYLNYMFEMPFQEISRIKNQTHIDLTTEEFLPFVMKSNKREDSGSQNPDKIPSSFGLQ